MDPGKWNDDFSRGMDQRISAILSRTGCKGLSVAFCGTDRILLSGCGGVQNGQTCDPVTENTVFWGDQLAAPVAAYVAWKLNEDGIVDLNRPLTEYTAEPFLPGERNLDYVTGRAVLSQTSGFPMRKDPAMPTHIELMPTTLFSYSAYALLYLQRALEQAAKCDFQTLAQEIVFRPFHMNDSSFVWRPDYADRFAHPHDAKGQPLLKVQAEKPNISRYFYTTPRDYCLFLNKLFVPQTSKKCLTPLMLERMLAPQIALYGGLKWANGIGLYETAADRMLWQFGDHEGTKALAFVDRNADVAGCVTVNDLHGMAAAQMLMKECTGSPLAAWEEYDGFSFAKLEYDRKVRAAKKKYS